MFIMLSNFFCQVGCTVLQTDPFDRNTKLKTNAFSDPLARRRGGSLGETAQRTCRLVSTVGIVTLPEQLQFRHGSNHIISLPADHKVSGETLR